ncbi:apolipoprotein A-II [Triplophysa rosa]|uniref:14 kDa apolipoprotein n=1 Tax=Triplophysa rosa TaxID=992332 RepID=A0A9W8C4Z3_TRIRA|nr:apolipoprotein A-II [Triplophysa rosa]KAI7807074.1 14 kDa apolipoprotein [Triplophysa rosa]
MKLTLVLILALQVSVCVWAEPIPEPDKELVEKYEGLKAVFFKRLVNAYSKFTAAVEPLMESSPAGQTAKETLEEIRKRPRVESIIKILTGLASELEPVVDKARMSLLGAYGYYLRPYIGETLDKAISNIKPVLDTVMPAEN